MGDLPEPFVYLAPDYLRDRNRELTRENEWLRGQNEKLIRMIAIVLSVAVAQTNVDKLALLGLIEELDNDNQEREE